MGVGDPKGDPRNAHQRAEWGVNAVDELQRNGRKTGSPGHPHGE